MVCTILGTTNKQHYLGRSMVGITPWHLDMRSKLTEWKMILFESKNRPTGSQLHTYKSKVRSGINTYAIDTSTPPYTRPCIMMLDTISAVTIAAAVANKNP